jgi:flagellar protein FlaG
MSIPQVGSPGLDTQAMGKAREGPRPAAAANPAVGSGNPDNPRVASAAANAVQEQRASPEQVKEAVQQMNRAMRAASSALEFSVDQDTDRVIVTMTDRDTGEVVMQIPSQQTLALARYLDAASKGALLSQKA